MHPIFLDVETTDLGESARIVQLAYKNAATDEVVYELFKPPHPISCGAMAIHHITNKMVETKPDFEGSAHKEKLAHVLAENFLVAHNAPFDRGVLRAEGVAAPHFIDTLRVAQHLVESEEYKLQYLRYFLDLNVEGVAHDALGDVLVLEALFAHLKKVTQQTRGVSDDDSIFGLMEELSMTPILQKIFTFGKYKGKTFEEIAQKDSSYLGWLFNSETQKPERERNENLMHTLKVHLNISPTLF